MIHINASFTGDDLAEAAVYSPAELILLFEGLAEREGMFRDDLLDDLDEPTARKLVEFFNGLAAVIERHFEGDEA